MNWLSFLCFCYFISTGRLGLGSEDDHTLPQKVGIGTIIPRKSTYRNYADSNEKEFKYEDFSVAFLHYGGAAI